MKRILALTLTILLITGVAFAEPVQRFYDYTFSREVVTVTVETSPDGVQWTSESVDPALRTYPFMIEPGDTIHLKITGETADGVIGSCATVHTEELPLDVGCEVR
jgi:hypothetical protein